MKIDNELADGVYMHLVVSKYKKWQEVNKGVK